MSSNNKGAEPPAAVLVPAVASGDGGGGELGWKLSASGPRSRHVTASQAAQKLVTAEWALERRRAWLEALAADPEAQVVEVDASCRVWKKPVLRALLEGIVDDDDGVLDGKKDGTAAARDDTGKNDYASGDPLLSRVLPSLRSLRFDDAVAQLPTDQGLETYEYLASVFGSCPNLASVSLDDNALGTRGADRLRPLLGLPALRRLSLRNCGLARADAELLAGALARRDGGSSDGALLLLEGLRVSRNQIGPGGMAALGDRVVARCPNLKELDAAGTRAGRKGSRAVVAGLVRSGCRGAIRRLELDDAVLGWSEEERDTEARAEGGAGAGEPGDDPVTALCGFLRQAPALEVLGLNDTGVGEAGLRRVLRAVRESGSSRTLRVLRVGELGSEDAEDEDGGDEDEEEEGDDDDYSGDDGAGGATLFARILARALPAFASLEELHVQQNELGDAGARIVVKALSSSSVPLKILNLATNDLSSVDFLIDHPIRGLDTLLLEDNMDLADGVDPEDRAAVDALYRRVVWDEDGEEHDDGEEQEPGGAGAALAREGGGANAGDEEAEDELARALGAAPLSP
jgi:Ran GTPase-activating protein (RanGAP) involved in mRNA processing and transport